MFGRGDLKFALLDLLQERPKHGYEMMKDLENRAGGFYTPSAGAIYPTLQMLEDRGWVTVQTVEGKKVYTISDAGRAALTEHRQEASQREAPRGPWNWGEAREHRHERGREHEHEHGRHEHERGPRHGGPFGGGPFGRRFPEELRELATEGREVAHLMRAAVISTQGNPERLAQLRGIVERARNELRAFVGEQPSDAPSSGNPPYTPPTGPVEQI